jgi:hypothetical protein
MFVQTRTAAWCTLWVRIGQLQEHLRTSDIMSERGCSSKEGWRRSSAITAVFLNIRDAKRTTLECATGIQCAWSTNIPPTAAGPVAIECAGDPTRLSIIHRQVNDSSRSNEEQESQNLNFTQNLRFFYVINNNRGPGGSVSTATSHGPHGPGIESSGGEIFHTRPDRSRDPPSLLDNVQWVSFPGVKSAGVWRWPPTPI